MKGRQVGPDTGDVFGGYDASKASLDYGLTRIFNDQCNDQSGVNDHTHPSERIQSVRLLPARKHRLVGVAANGAPAGQLLPGVFVARRPVLTQACVDEHPSQSARRDTELVRLRSQSLVIGLVEAHYQPQCETMRSASSLMTRLGIG